MQPTYFFYPSGENVAIDLVISKEEALKGCDKEIFQYGMSMPLCVHLQPSTENGQVLILDSVTFTDENGCQTNKKVYITIKVQGQKKKRKWITFAAAVLAVLCLVIAVIVNWDIPKGESSFYHGPELDPAEVFPYYELRYYLSGLDGAELQAACLIYDSVMNFEPTCTLPRGIDRTECEQLMLLLKAECPELFQIDLSQKFHYYFLRDSNEVFSIDLQYDLTAEDYKTMRAACEEKIQTRMKYMQEMSDLEKEKYIFDYLTIRCRYDMEADNAGNAYGALIEDTAKCDGISLAMKWFMEAAGIQCLCILGDAKEGDIGHAWNMICLDGQYSNVDLTASMRYDEHKGLDIDNEVIYYRFNVSDAWFSDAYQVNAAFDAFVAKPRCTTNKYSYYASIGALIEEKRDLQRIANETFDKGFSEKKTQVLQFVSADEFFVFSNNLRDYFYFWHMNRNPSGKISIKWETLNDNVIRISISQSYS